MSGIKRVQIAALQLQLYFPEIHGPVAERTLLIQRGRADLCFAGLGITSKPIEANVIRVQFSALGDKCLQR